MRAISLNKYRVRDEVDLTMDVADNIPEVVLTDGTR